MNSRMNFEEKFLDYLEQRLPQDEKEELEQQLKSDTVLAEAFRRYKLVAQAESSLAAKNFELERSLRPSIMSQIESEAESTLFKLKRLIFGAELFGTLPRRIGGIATVAAAVLAVIILIDSSEKGERHPLQLDSESRLERLAKKESAIQAPAQPAASKPKASTPDFAREELLDLKQRRFDADIADADGVEHFNKESLDLPKDPPPRAITSEAVSQFTLSEGIAAGRSARSYPEVLQLLDRGVIVRPDPKQRLELSRYILGDEIAEEPSADEKVEDKSSASSLSPQAGALPESGMAKGPVTLTQLVERYLNLLGIVTPEKSAELELIRASLENDILGAEGSPAANNNALKFKEILGKTKRAYERNSGK